MNDDQPLEPLPDPAAPWPAGWEAHKIDQLRFIAKNTTPMQRMQWLIDVLELLRPQLPELLANRQRLNEKWRAQHLAERATGKESGEKSSVEAEASPLDQAKAATTPR